MITMPYRTGFLPLVLSSSCPNLFQGPCVDYTFSEEMEHGVSFEFGNITKCTPCASVS